MSEQKLPRANRSSLPSCMNTTLVLTLHTTTLKMWTAATVVVFSERGVQFWHHWLVYGRGVPEHFTTRGTLQYACRREIWLRTITLRWGTLVADLWNLYFLLFQTIMSFCNEHEDLGRCHISSVQARPVVSSYSVKKALNETETCLGEWNPCLDWTHNSWKCKKL